MDVVIVDGRTREENDKNLLTLLNRFRHRGIRIKPSKLIAVILICWQCYEQYGHQVVTI